VSLPPPLDLLPALLPGLARTAGIAAGAISIALLLAPALAIVRIEGARVSRAAATIFVEGFRGTSAIVQLFWFYFALPALLGVRLPALPVGIAVLGLHGAAYGAEIFRGAIHAVPREQWEAARAIGLDRRRAYRHVILPQALRIALPPLGNLLVELVKATALVSLITIDDLTRRALVLRDATLRTGEIFLCVLLLYAAVALAITRGTVAIERRLGRGSTARGPAPSATGGGR